MMRRTGGRAQFCMHPRRPLSAHHVVPSIEQHVPAHKSYSHKHVSHNSDPTTGFPPASD
jgi:hypothetical protein